MSMIVTNEADEEMPVGFGWHPFFVRTPETDGPFRVVVVYTPPGKDFVCVEPASNCIDALNLSARGQEDTGMLVLPPGASVSGSMLLRPFMA